MKTIEARNLIKIFKMGETEVIALDDVSLSVDSGEFVAITGQSGSGKSTLMNILGCLDVPTRGEYFIDGEKPALYAGVKEPEARKLAFEKLKIVELENRVEHFPYQLSGGQQQRVAIARSLVNNPSIILADEPTGNLDTQTGRAIINLFKQLNSQNNVTIIMVTHEHDIAQHAKRVVSLRDGKIIE
jgi:putative ABC transport system ATP-binding protein